MTLERDAQEVAQVDGSMQAASAKSEKLSQKLAEMTLERDALRAELGAAREVAEVSGDAAEVGKLGALRAAAASDASAAALLLAKAEGALEALESKIGGAPSTVPWRCSSRSARTPRPRPR